MELRRPASTGDHLYELDHLTILQYFVIHDDFAVARGDHRLGLILLFSNAESSVIPGFISYSLARRINLTMCFL